MPRDEVRIEYTDEDGDTLEAYRVGEHFAVRAMTPLDDNRVTFNGVSVLCTHAIVFLPNGYIMGMPTEQLAWFYADELAIHADDKSFEEIEEFMEASREWGMAVIATGEMISYRKWLRNQGN